MPQHLTIRAGSMLQRQVTAQAAPPPMPDPLAEGSTHLLYAPVSVNMFNLTDKWAAAAVCDSYGSLFPKAMSMITTLSTSERMLPTDARACCSSRGCTAKFSCVSDLCCDCVTFPAAESCSMQSRDSCHDSCQDGLAKVSGQKPRTCMMSCTQACMRR